MRRQVRGRSLYGRRGSTAALRTRSRGVGPEDGRHKKEEVRVSVPP